MRLNTLSNFVNGNICGGLYFAWVDPSFSTTNAEGVYVRI